MDDVTRLVFIPPACWLDLDSEMAQLAHERFDQSLGAAVREKKRHWAGEQHFHSRDKIIFFPARRAGRNGTEAGAAEMH